MAISSLSTYKTLAKRMVTVIEIALLMYVAMLPFISASSAHAATADTNRTNVAVKNGM
jgi:uncharacterized membrane protein